MTIFIRMVFSALGWKCHVCGYKWSWDVDVCKNCGHEYCKEKCTSD